MSCLTRFGADRFSVDFDFFSGLARFFLDLAGSVHYRLARLFHVLGEIAKRNGDYQMIAYVGWDLRFVLD